MIAEDANVHHHNVFPFLDVHESGKRLELVAGFVQRHLQLIAILDMYTIDSVLYPTPLGLEIVVEIDLWLFDMRVRTNRRREAMR